MPRYLFLLLLGISIACCGCFKRKAADSKQDSPIKKNNEAPDVLASVIRELDRLDEDRLKERLNSFGYLIATILDAGIKSPSPEIRMKAVSISYRACKPEETIRRIHKLLDDPDKNVREHTAFLLNELGHYSPKIVEPLIEHLLARNFWFDQQQLSEMGPGLAGVMLQMLLDTKREKKMRIAAAGFFQEYGHEFRNRQQISKLTDSLSEGDQLTRRLAAIVHVSLAPTDQSPLSVLLETINDKSAGDRIQLHSFIAISKIEFGNSTLPPDVATQLFHCFSLKNGFLHQRVMSSLKKKKLSEDQVAALIALCKEKNSERILQDLIVHGVTFSEKYVPEIIKYLELNDAQPPDMCPSNEQRMAVFRVAKEIPDEFETICNVFFDPTANVNARTNIGISLMQSNLPFGHNYKNQLQKMQLEENENLQQIASIILVNEAQDIGSHKPFVLAALASDLYFIQIEANLLLEKFPDQVQKYRDDLFALLSNDNMQSLNPSNLAEELVKLGTLTDHETEILVNKFFSVDRISRSHFEKTIAQSPQVIKSLAQLYLDDLVTNEGKKRILRVFANVANQHEADVTLVEIANKALHSEDQDLRKQAIVTLAILKPKDPDLIAALSKELADGLEFDFRYQLLQSKNLSIAVPIIADQLEQGISRNTYLELLASAGPDSAEAAPAIARNLYSHQTFNEAIKAVQAIGPAAKPAIPALLKLLKHPGRMVSVASTLNKVEAPGDTVTEIVKENLEDPVTRSQAIVSIGHLGETGRHFLPFLMNEFKSDNRSCVIAAAFALGQLKEIPKDAILLLVGGLEDQNFDVQIACMQAIQKVLPDHKLCVPTLIKQIDHPVIEVRIAAIDTLASYKIDARPAVDKLIAATDDSQLFYNAVSCLGAIGPNAKKSVPKIVNYLSNHWNGVIDNDQYVSAIQALGEIGPAAKEALPILEKLLQSNYQGIRAAAASALWKIDPDTAKKVGAEQPKEEVK